MIPSNIWSTPGPMPRVYHAPVARCTTLKQLHLQSGKGMRYQESETNPLRGQERPDCCGVDEIPVAPFIYKCCPDASPHIIRGDEPERCQPDMKIYPGGD
jgi:hypothetical protein